jgi:hypothetical protein
VALALAPRRRQALQLVPREVRPERPADVLSVDEDERHLVILAPA